MLRLSLIFAGCVALVAIPACLSERAAGAGYAASASHDTAPRCRVLRVVDGDTVDLTCPGTARFRARLTGFDTPETYRPGCAAEARLGADATARLRGLVAHATTTQARLGDWDRYDRRLVALILDGRDVGDTLISEGLALPYSGGRRPDWCARLS